MKKRIVIPLLEVVFLTVSLVVAVIFLASRSWFGAGDLSSFSFWSIVLSLPIVPASFLLGWLFARRGSVLGLFLAVLSGGLLGYLATMLVWLMLGPWFGAFSFPVFYCWLAGAITACVVATLLSKKKNADPVAGDKADKSACLS